MTFFKKTWGNEKAGLAREKCGIYIHICMGNMQNKQGSHIMLNVSFNTLFQKLQFEIYNFQKKKKKKMKRKRKRKKCFGHIFSKINTYL